MIGRLATVFGLLASIVVVVMFLTGAQNLKDIFPSAQEPDRPVNAVAHERLAPADLAMSTAPAETLQPPTGPTFHPSFDCATDRGEAEQAICADAQLSALDLEMARLYFKLRSRESGSDREQLIQAQRDWLSARSTCHGPEIGQCVSDLYQTRIAELRALSGN